MYNAHAGVVATDAACVHATNSIVTGEGRLQSCVGTRLTSSYATVMQLLLVCPGVLPLTGT